MTASFLAEGRRVARMDAKRRASVFFAQAQKIYDKVSLPCSEVPFEAYFPIYSDMSVSQFEWYLYWRAQHRLRESLPVSASYIFVHAYELIHLVGADSAEDAFRQLRRLWMSYRDVYPSLDQYLPGWCLDMVRFYSIQSPPLREWAQEVQTWLFDDLAVKRWASQQEVGNFPVRSWAKFITHRPSRAAFGKAATPEQRLEIQSAMCQAIVFAERWWREDTGESLADFLTPGEVFPLRRTAFAGAVFAGREMIYVVDESRLYHLTGTLSVVLTLLAKVGENVIREKYGKVQLKVEAPFPELFAAVTEELRQIFCPPPEREVQEQVPVFRLDRSRLAQLQEETDALRERLVREMSELDALPAMPPPSLPVPAEVEMGSPLLDLPRGVADLSEDAGSSGSADTPARLLVRRLLELGGRMKWSQVTLPAGAFPAALLDEVNEAGFDEVGDLSLFEEGDEVVAGEEALAFLQQFIAG